MLARDNPRPDPARLYGVAEPDPWEGELRRCLTDQASLGRAPGTDLAGTAIARGRRVRRRRQAAGLVSVVGATVLATGIAFHDWQGPAAGGGPGPATELVRDSVTAGPPPQQPARLAADPALAEELAVDLVGAGSAGGVVLATGDGRTIDLGPVDEVTSAHRVGESWAVVSGGPGTTRLWWVGRDRAPVPLLAGMDAIVVERAQVAWRRGALLATATLSGRGALVDQATTAAPDGPGQPVGFLGRTVLLARSDPAGWDTWRPVRGDYVPSWTDQVLRVYGALPGGQSAVGLVPPAAGPAAAGGGACLARLELIDRLTPAQAGCPVGGLSADAPAALSPEGRWLIATVEGDDPGPVLVDVAAALAEQPAAVVRVPELAGLAGRPVWLDSGQALVPTAETLVRVVPEKLLAGLPGGVEVMAVTWVGLLVVQPV